MERHVGGAPPPHHRGRQVSCTEAAHANEYFEHFLNATTLKNILGYHRSMCELLHLKPNVFPQFYPKLRASLTSWKAKALWKKFDSRISHKCYGKGKACQGTRVLIIGAGPCGLRTAIEAQLLGAKVVVVEKRDRLSRNNVLHLWPFVIEDLRTLGAKKFFGKFCAGAIDHISIRQLQCILLKVALLLGVEIHTEVSFERLREPDAIEKIGWRAEVLPKDHPVSQYEFDVIIGADGKRNTLQGFKRKEFRGKLAIAITANFINKKSEAEARVEEISGVAFIFNQKFFKDLQAETRIDLENIVYYKDDTHYFVMTAKKASLLEKGVIKQDLSDTEKLLAPENVDREALQNYAREAADFSTNYQLPELEFAVNHYGQPDVAMFDFTSMYAAEYASKVIERHGTRLLTILVGDSLLEPFWPTGSGCARGFLSSLDAAWAIRSYCSGQMTALDVLAERESIYRLLAQTTPDNLNKDWKAYTLDPATRYPNLNKSVVTPLQTVCLYDTDAPESIERMKRASLDSLGRQEHMPKKRRRGNVDVEVLLTWLSEQLRAYDDVAITDLISVFRPGKALCALLHHYRPDLVDYAAVMNNEPAKCNQLAMEILEKELGLSPFMTGDELTNSDDFLSLTTYLTQVYDTFRGEIPHIKHPKLELPESNKRSEFSFKTIKTSSIANNQTSRPSSRHKRHADIAIVQKPSSIDRKQRKRRTLDRIGPSVEERQKTLEEIAANRQDRQEKRKQQRRRQTEQFVKSMQMLQANCKPDQSEPFEDYSIFLYRQTAPKFQDRVKDLEKQFTYVPDYDTKLTGLKPLTNTNAEEDIASKIRSLEDKWSNRQPAEKKPKDLMRAIGKIETSDWNIKQIEKKILENKMGKPSTLNADKERVPRWSKEEFKARQTKMEKKHLDRQDSSEIKFADIDRNIKQLDLKLREGTNRELGQNKVASITEKLVKKTPQNQEKSEKPAQPKPVNLPIQNGSEYCHFCAKRVYLMERLSAEGRFFHHGCFKCQYCHTQLRLGSYMFDRDGQFGYRFYCIHHFGMQGELPRPTKVARKPSQRGSREVGRSPQKRHHHLSGVAGVDLLDRVETPERVEFANLSSGHVSSDRDEPLSQMDEDEWTDKNFGASANELDDSDDDDFSSSLSDTDSDDEDAFDDALEQPMTREGTMKLAQIVRNTHRKSRDSGSDGYSSSDRSSYYENTSDDSDSDTATEGEDEIRARELRRREVLVEAPIVPTDTETEDTEVRKMKKSSSSDDAFKSAESDLDVNRNVVAGKLTLTAKIDPKTALSKSATCDNLVKPTQRNFVIRPRTSLPDPTVQLDQPLLVIRRPPNKVNLPKEIKPKVAVNATKFDARKYFGQPKPPSSKPLNKPLSKPPSEPVNKPLSKPNNIRSFSFELKDTDLDEVDGYIEQLISNERELQKPATESLSSSIEDLLHVLDSEPQKEVDQKAEDLLKWIEELEHQNPNVEHRKPQKGCVRKLSTDSKRFFENVLSPRKLGRSKTESQIAQKKDLDATIDVKSVLRKFESLDQPDPVKTSPLVRKGSDCVTQKGYLARKRSDSVKTSSPAQKDFLPRKGSLVQPNLVKTSFLPQKDRILAQNGSFDQPDPLKINYFTQKADLAQKGCLNQPDLVKTISPGQKNFLAKKMFLGHSDSTSSLAQKEYFIQPDLVLAQKDLLPQTGFLDNSVKTSSLTQREYLAQKELSDQLDPINTSFQAENRFSDQPDPVQTSSETQKETKSLEQTMEELEKFVDETIENIGKGSWCGNVSVTSRLSPEYLEMAQKAQMPRPHDFSKAVESSSDSEDERTAAHAQKPDNVPTTRKMSVPPGPPKFPAKFGRKDPDKDCCIQ